MNSRTLILMVLVSLWLTEVKAQEMQSNRIYSGEINKIAFFVYPAETKIKAEAKSHNEIDFQYPEALVFSIMSCNNEKWEVFHTLGGKENADIKPAQHYAFIQYMDKEKNYFELKHKFEIEIMGVPTAVIKYYLITEQSPEPQAGIITMQKIDNRWQKCSMKMFSKIAMIALRMNSDKLEKIINGDTGDKYLKDINSKVFDGNTLNFDKLSSEVDSWYVKETKNNQEMKNYFKDTKSLF